ncbi:MAG: LiaF domain-containing protein [Actinomycetota bacterium]
MKTLARTLITVVAVSIAVRLVGREMAKRFQGDTHPDNDTFRVMAFLGGSSISSHALSLRSIQAKVRAGGIDLDLTGATLSPEGAHLDIDVMAGGMEVTVPVGWRVYVVQQVEKGEVEVDVTDPATLPTDAPVLTVQAEVRAGGVTIKARPRVLA